MGLGLSADDGLRSRGLPGFGPDALLTELRQQSKNRVANVTTLLARIRLSLVVGACFRLALG